MQRVKPSTGAVNGMILSVVLMLACPICAAEGAGPLTPEASLAAIRTRPGLRVELVAAEPMIVSPVAFAFDARGRLFVAENRGYPSGPEAGQPPAGRIAMLEDRDGDGAMDCRTEFAEGLTFPNGVMPWRGGLIVTCAPEVLWLVDRDGDGKADERRVLITGFSTRGSTQLRVSHPTLSPDNWVYLTSGLTGGSVTSPAAPEHEAVNLGRTDFRFRPDSNVFEAADGGSQFGLSFDDYGHRFICYNRVQVQHVVIPSTVLRRNPRLGFAETVENCPADMAPEPLKGHGAAARLYPISRNITTADSHAGTFTAACAVTVFRGDGLPEAYRGGVFSCDPTGNLVHFDRLEATGATFRARPAEVGVEFLASADNWMRPVFLSSGPDGALYVCDMYRKTIEHPDYLPVEVRKRTDFVSGKTMGRIWRVIRDDMKSADLKARRRLNLEPVATADLCRELSNPNGWHRDVAHRLLLERQDPAAVPLLQALVSDAQSPAAAVVLGIWLLEDAKALSDAMLSRLLHHPVAGVCENALRVAESRFVGEPSRRGEVVERATDNDARVRFQTAVALSALRDRADETNEVASALARIASRDSRDRWARAAVFSALPGREKPFLLALRSFAKRNSEIAPELLAELGRLLAASVGRPDLKEIVRGVVGGMSDDMFRVADQAALLAGLAEGIQAKEGKNGSDDALVVLAGGETGLLESIQRVVEGMKVVAADSAADQDRRKEAVALLGFAGLDRAGKTLLELLAPGQPGALQVAAVRALGSTGDARVAGLLLAPETFGGSTPSVRDEILAIVSARSATVTVLLDAVHDGRIPASAVDTFRRRQLTQFPDRGIRERATALFGAVASDRAQVYDAYKNVIQLAANPDRGREVFRRECAQCHRLDQEGHNVGPDLFGIRNQPKEAILLHVLVPDQEITTGFTAYTVATADGRVLTGLLAAESPAAITLRQALGKEDSIPRDQVAEMTASRQSLMPQGLEKSISRQDFADLLAYLKGEAAGR